MGSGFGKLDRIIITIPLSLEMMATELMPLGMKEESASGDLVEWNQAPEG